MHLQDLLDNWGRLITFPSSYKSFTGYQLEIGLILNCLLITFKAPLNGKAVPIRSYIYVIY